MAVIDFIIYHHGRPWPRSIVTGAHAFAGGKTGCLAKHTVVDWSMDYHYSSLMHHIGRFRLLR
jgi:hypothetical protein